MFGDSMTHLPSIVSARKPVMETNFTTHKGEDTILTLFFRTMRRFDILKRDSFGTKDSVSMKSRVKKTSTFSDTEKTELRQLLLKMHCISKQICYKSYSVEYLKRQLWAEEKVHIYFAEIVETLEQRERDEVNFICEKLSIENSKTRNIVRQAVCLGKDISFLHYGFQITLLGSVLVGLRQLSCFDEFPFDEIVSCEFIGDEVDVEFSRRVFQTSSRYLDLPSMTLVPMKEGSTSDVYKFLDEEGTAVGVFKPRLGEAGMPYSHSYSESGAIKQKVSRAVYDILENSHIKEKADEAYRLMAFLFSSRRVLNILRAARRISKLETPNPLLFEQKLPWKKIFHLIKVDVLEQLRRGEAPFTLSLRESQVPGHGFKNEVAAYYLAKCMGFSVVPPTIFLNLDNHSRFYPREYFPVMEGSVQAYIPSYISAHTSICRWERRNRSGEETIEDPYPRLETWALKELVLLDLLIMNTDRNRGNYDVVHNKAIDHALAFPFEKEGVMELDLLLSLSMRGDEKILSTEEREKIQSLPLQFLRYIFEYQCGMPKKNVENWFKSMLKIKKILREDTKGALDVVSLIQSVFYASDEDEFDSHYIDEEKAA